MGLAMYEGRDLANFICYSNTQRQINLQLPIRGSKGEHHGNTVALALVWVQGKKGGKGVKEVKCGGKPQICVTLSEIKQFGQPS